MNIDVTNPTLHLPRILCLHGSGTNAHILRMQCRVLQRMLSPFFRLVFAEAPFPAEPGPDVTSAYKDYGPFKSWLRVRPQDPVLDPQFIVEKIEMSLSTARLEDDQQGGTGEWVALLGFGQGGKLAASILMNQQELRWRMGPAAVSPVYRFAVLLAARGPLVWLHPNLYMPKALISASGPTLGQHSHQNIATIQDRLRIPTVHIHRRADPGLEAHQKLLYQYCDPRVAILVEWDRHHRVPIKAADIQPVVEEIVLTARRTGVIRSTAESGLGIDRFSKAYGEPPFYSAYHVV
ncbi:serine hydrolase FSH [Phaeosphaeriaceae sp. PMI808]|nr:serine hydrolase FSH [Phaeosphaeriaceae sp. PMI808]